MRLLVVGIDTSVLDPSSASAQRQVSYYHGWDVDIVLLAVGKAIRIDLAPNIRIHRSGGANKAAALWNGYALCKKLVRGSVYDVISSQDPLWCGFAASRISAAFSVPLHLQDHSGFFSRAWYSRTDRLLFPFAKHIARKASRIRTVSQRGKNGLLRLGVPEDQVDVIPIATDVTRFSNVPPRSDAKHVLCVARLEREKGVDVLLRAWKRVIASSPDAVLRIVGDGSQRRSLEDLAKELGITVSVEFCGKRNDVLPELAWSSIVVQPSRFEGWGLSVIEAVAAGRSVVMTDVGCAGEVIVNKNTGLVVPVEDPIALAEGIIELLDHAGEAEIFARNARSIVMKLELPERSQEHIRDSFEKTRRDRRTLIFAQAVDEQDALFGFFVPWLRAFSLHADAIVCALRVGDPLPDLPKNIDVRALRKKGSRSRIEVIMNALQISWIERKRYSSVFVRGDAQYIVLCGWLWRLLGKRVVFWYTHYNSRSPWFWLAVPWANEVVTAVPESNPLSSAIKIGHHIDIDHFTPEMRDMNVGTPHVLLFGRVSAVKRVAWMVRVLRPLVDAGRVRLKIVGTPTTEESAQELLRSLPDQMIWERRVVTNAEAPSLYRSADIFVNATPGSMDKTILEAAACGCVVLAATRGFLRGLPKELHWLHFSNERELASDLERICHLTVEDRRRIGMRLRDWVSREHSLTANVSALIRILSHGARV